MQIIFTAIEIWKWGIVRWNNSLRTILFLNSATNVFNDDTGLCKCCFHKQNWQFCYKWKWLGPLQLQETRPETKFNYPLKFKWMSSIKAKWEAKWMSSIKTKWEVWHILWNFDIILYKKGFLKCNQYVGNIS